MRQKERPLMQIWAGQLLLTSIGLPWTLLLIVLSQAVRGRPWPRLGVSSAEKNKWKIISKAIISKLYYTNSNFPPRLVRAGATSDNLWKYYSFKSVQGSWIKVSNSWPAQNLYEWPFQLLLTSIGLLWTLLQLVLSKAVRGRPWNLFGVSSAEKIKRGKIRRCYFLPF